MMSERDYVGMEIGFPAPKPDEPPPDKRARKGGKRAGAVKRRFGLLNAVTDSALPQIPTRAALAAWLILFRHAKPDGIVTASVADLARRAGCNVATLKRGLAKLQAAGLLERVKRGTLAGGPSVWRLLTPEGDRP
jgi:hypothetical protein